MSQHHLLKETRRTRVSLAAGMCWFAGIVSHSSSLSLNDNEWSNLHLIKHLHYARMIHFAFHPRFFMVSLPRYHVFEWFVSYTTSLYPLSWFSETFAVPLREVSTGSRISQWYAFDLAILEKKEYAEKTGELIWNWKVRGWFKLDNALQSSNEKESTRSRSFHFHFLITSKAYNWLFLEAVETLPHKKTLTYSLVATQDSLYNKHLTSACCTNY